MGIRKVRYYYRILNTGAYVAEKIRFSSLPVAGKKKKTVSFESHVYQSTLKMKG